MLRHRHTLYHRDWMNKSAPPAAGTPREAWHDIHCKVEGPAARDVMRNFEERWLRQARPSPGCYPSTAAVWQTTPKQRLSRESFDHLHVQQRSDCRVYPGLCQHVLVANMYWLPNLPGTMVHRGHLCPKAQHTPHQMSGTAAAVPLSLCAPACAPALLSTGSRFGSSAVVCR